MSLIERALKKVEPDASADGGPSSPNKRVRRNSTAMRNKHSLQDMLEKSPLSLDELRELGIATDRKTANAFRELRTELVKAVGGKNFVLAVSSCKSGTGTSFVSTNLALSFAQDATKSALEDIIYSVKINKLRVIPSRKSDLHEIDSFTTSSKLGELIYELKNRFPDRYIILDVSDIESSADAKILDLIAQKSYKLP